MRTIASLGCKLLGIYSMIQGLNGSGSVFSVIYISADNQPDTTRIITLITAFILPVIFGVLLWLLSDKLSVIMVKEDTGSNRGLETKDSEIHRISFSVLGLYFIGDSLIKLVHLITSVYPLAGLSRNLIGISSSTIIELIIGSGIFLGSRSLVNFLNTNRK